MRELIRLVQAHMDEYGVSEAEVARRIGANPQTVNTWRNGEMKQLPRQQYLQKLAELTKTDYRSVLTAALLDTGYIASVPESQTDHISALIELSFLADDVDSAASLSLPSDVTDPEEVEWFVGEAQSLVDAAEYLTHAVHRAVLDAVGGDVNRLRQIKREIRRFNTSKYGPGLIDPSMRDNELPFVARTTPPKHQKGQGDQGTAGGEENQDTAGDDPA